MLESSEAVTLVRFWADVSLSEARRARYKRLRWRSSPTELERTGRTLASFAVELERLCPPGPSGETDVWECCEEAARRLEAATLVRGDDHTVSAVRAFRRICRRRREATTGKFLRTPADGWRPVQPKKKA